jgi:hypothetical protein
VPARRRAPVRAAASAGILGLALAGCGVSASAASPAPPSPVKPVIAAHDELLSTWLSVDSAIGVRYTNRYGILIRLPPARTLVQIWNRHHPRLGEPMRYARTPAGVLPGKVVYVIGAGSSSKKLEMAVIGLNGRRYTLRTTVGGNYHPKFGTG